MRRFRFTALSCRILPRLARGPDVIKDLASIRPIGLRMLPEWEMCYPCGAGIVSTHPIG